MDEEESVVEKPAEIPEAGLGTDSIMPSDSVSGTEKPLAAVSGTQNAGVWETETENPPAKASLPAKES